MFSQWYLRKTSGDLLFVFFTVCWSNKYTSITHADKTRTKIVECMTSYIFGWRVSLLEFLSSGDIGRLFISKTSLEQRVYRKQTLYLYKVRVSSMYTLPSHTPLVELYFFFLFFVSCCCCCCWLSQNGACMVFLTFAFVFLENWRIG